MLVGGYLGTATVLILLGKSIESSPSKEQSGVSSIINSGDDVEQLPNPLLVFLKVVLYAGAFLMIVLNFVAMRSIVIHQGLINNTALVNNLTEQLNLGFRTSVGMGLFSVMLLFIIVILIVLAWAGKIPAQLKGFGKGLNK